MAGLTPEPMSGRSTGVFAISVAAEMVSMEVQNLRVYERRGLLAPARTPGGTRLYSHDDLERLARIRDLLGEGLNLAGVGRVLSLEARVRRLEESNTELRRRLKQFGASRDLQRSERVGDVYGPGQSGTSRT